MDSYRKAEPRRKASSHPSTEKGSSEKTGRRGAERPQPAHADRRSAEPPQQTHADRRSGEHPQQAHADRRSGEHPQQAHAVRQAEQLSPAAPRCPVYKKCGGCDFQGMPYERQLSWKNRRVRELLEGSVRNIRPIIGMKDPLHYRCKIHAAFDHDRKGNPVSGIYERNSHMVVPVDSCMIEDETADAIIVSIRNLLKDFRIKIYDEDTGYGLFRHVLIRKGHATGEYLAVLVTASVIFPSRNNFVKALRKEHPEITSIVQNINERTDSMVLGERNITLYGPGFIVDELCGKKFRISPNSFYQVNPQQTEILYRTAIESAHLSGSETVLDAYCGTGTIGIIASQQAGRVIGVELNKDAVKDAVRNAAMNHIENIVFLNQDAGEYLSKKSGDFAQNPGRRKDPGEAAEDAIDVVIMDPPRAGSTKEFIESVRRSGAGRVVYVSCDPDTLARDLKIFENLGFAAEMTQPVDMFPFTRGIETVVSLKRR